MKVCILSMQKVNNYGSVLQAYSLKKMIESLGHEVSFIDIKKGENDILNLQCEQQEHCGLSQSNKMNSRKNNTLILKIKSKVNNYEIHKMYKNFREKELKIGRKDNTDNFDFCVIGSDEVFNCLQKSKWGFSSQLYGNVKNAKNVITYAACCGSTKEENLTKELKEEIKKSMSNLSNISVRDENTYDFVKKITGRSPVYNLDPVAVGDFSKEISNINLKNKLPEKYCIVYSYSGRFSDEKVIEKIKEYCKKRNLTLIAPFGKQNWIHTKVVLSPFELLKAFQNSECVITDTFHGTLFGAKFAKKMAIIIRESNRNKLYDLINRLELKDHLLENVCDLDKVLDIEINRKNIDSIIKEERRLTLNYLETSIK